MKVGLLAADSKIPNLAIMKLSAYYKSKGDQVGWLKEFENPDKIYVSIIFRRN